MNAGHMNAAVAGIVSSWAEVNGVALRYEISGDGPSEIVLVHEMGGNMENWDAVLPLILKGRRILRYDTRGAGRSEKIRGKVSIDDFVGDLAAMIDVARMTAPALIGIAVGAATAIRFAARNPARAGCLVAMSPATGVAPEKHAETLALADRLAREGVRGRVMERIEATFPRQFRDDPARFEAYRCRLIGNDPDSYAAQYRMLTEMDLSADLRAIACPTLMLAGETDKTRPPAMIARVAETVPGARFEALMTGHSMADITPALVADRINAFLGTLGR